MGDQRGEDDGVDDPEQESSQERNGLASRRTILFVPGPSDLCPRPVTNRWFWPCLSTIRVHSCYFIGYLAVLVDFVVQHTAGQQFANADETLAKQGPGAFHG